MIYVIATNEIAIYVYIYIYVFRKSFIHNCIIYGFISNVPISWKPFIGGPGPHPMSCLIAWWQDAGCSLNGSASPTVNDGNIEYWNAIMVRSVKADMLLYFRWATNGREDYDLKCFGIWIDVLTNKKISGHWQPILGHQYIDNDNVILHLTENNDVHMIVFFNITILTSFDQFRKKW